MSYSIAGHTFNSLTPGEHCVGEDCKGVGSLLELLALSGIAKAGDKNISHAGTELSDDSIEMMRQAKADLNAHFTKVMGF